MLPMDNAVCDDAVLIDLRGLEPTPDRLLTIVEASLELDVKRIAIDWGGRFPWSVDPNVRARSAFPEALVSAVDAKVARTGTRLSTVIRRLLPEGYSSCHGYRHLEDAMRDETAEWRPALEKLASDVVDDLCSLMPTMRDLDLCLGEPERRVLERIARDAGLVCHVRGCRTDPDDEREEHQSGIEERLWRSDHPAGLGGSFAGLHEGVKRWRVDAWARVRALHEDLVCAALDPSLSARCTLSCERLGEQLRGIESTIETFRRAYAGLSTDDAVDRYFQAVCAPLREQFGQLRSRAETLRMRYPGDTGVPGSIAPPV